MQDHTHAADSSGARQARKRKHTVERMRAITDKLGGIWRELDGKPVGEHLRCPLCEKYKMKIKLGDKTPVATPVVFCAGCKKNSTLLINAIRRETGIWLAPPPRRLSPREAVDGMRRSPAYQGLPARSKKLVDHLVEAVMVNRRSNGFVDRTEAEPIAVLGTRSKRQVGEAGGFISTAISAPMSSGGSGRTPNKRRGKRWCGWRRSGC
jgi:hypothetical protein